MNRLLEFQFHDAEFLLCAVALLFGNTTEVTEASSLLKKLWPKMLLNQFHDVLPGSSIELVWQFAWLTNRLVFCECYSNSKTGLLCASTCNGPWTTNDEIFIDSTQCFQVAPYGCNLRDLNTFSLSICHCVLAHVLIISFYV